MAQFTRWKVDQLRDLRKREYGEPTKGKWLDADIIDVARFFLVKLLRDHSIELASAWQLANSETVGSIAARVARRPGALQYENGKPVKDRNLIIPLSFELVGMKATGGRLFMWGPTLPANTYSDLHEARKEAGRKSEGPHIITVLDLEEVAEILFERIGRPIATVKET